MVSVDLSSLALPMMKTTEEVKCPSSLMNLKPLPPPYCCCDVVVELADEEVVAASCAHGVVVAASPGN